MTRRLLTSALRAGTCGGDATCVLLKAVPHTGFPPCQARATRQEGFRGPGRAYTSSVGKLVAAQTLAMIHVQTGPRQIGSTPGTSDSTSRADNTIWPPWVPVTITITIHGCKDPAECSWRTLRTQQAANMLAHMRIASRIHTSAWPCMQASTLNWCGSGCPGPR